MNLKDTAECLAELGHETRLDIFRFLVKSGHKKVKVGDIQKDLNIPNSTLSHHLSRLAGVGLIIQEKSGRQIICQPQFEQIQGMIDFLLEECCEGEECMTSKNCC